MSSITVAKCDGCGKIIEKATETFRLCFTSVGSFPDPSGGTDHTFREINLDFCYGCATRIEMTLKRIEKRLEND